MYYQGPEEQSDSMSKAKEIAGKIAKTIGLLLGIAASLGCETNPNEAVLQKISSVSSPARTSIADVYTQQPQSSDFTREGDPEPVIESEQ